MTMMMSRAGMVSVSVPSVITAVRAGAMLCMFAAVAATVTTAAAMATAAATAIALMVALMVRLLMAVMIRHWRGARVRAPRGRRRARAR